jgi:hypothetical protein
VDANVASTVPLDLGDVVGDVVHLQRRRRDAFTEDAGDRAPYEVGDRLPVCEGEVRRRRHRPEVRSPFRRGQGRARELPVRQRDLEPT